MHLINKCWWFSYLLHSIIKMTLSGFLTMIGQWQSEGENNFDFFFTCFFPGFFPFLENFFSNISSILCKCVQLLLFTRGRGEDNQSGMGSHPFEHHNCQDNFQHNCWESEWYVWQININVCFFKIYIFSNCPHGEKSKQTQNNCIISINLFLLESNLLN